MGSYFTFTGAAAFESLLKAKNINTNTVFIVFTQTQRQRNSVFRLVPMMIRNLATINF